MTLTYTQTLLELWFDDNWLASPVHYCSKRRDVTHLLRDCRKEEVNPGNPVEALDLISSLSDSFSMTMAQEALSPEKPTYGCLN
jgi:hypothetical protein